MVKPYASSLQSIDPWSYKLVGPTRQYSLHRTNDIYEVGAGTTGITGAMQVAQMCARL